MTPKYLPVFNGLCLKSSKFWWLVVDGLYLGEVKLSMAENSYAGQKFLDVIQSDRFIPLLEVT